MKAFFTVLLVAFFIQGGSSLGLTWREGTAISSEYAEISGTVEWDGAGPVILHAEGRDFRLVIPDGKPNAAGIIAGAVLSARGIAVRFQTWGSPDQNLFWPFSVWSGDLRVQYPLAAEQFREWLGKLLSSELES